MCKAVSGIVTSDGVCYMPDPTEWKHSHTHIRELHKLPDGLYGDKYARFECTPQDGNFRSDPMDWKFMLDEKTAPQWWIDDAAHLEDKCRREVKRWMRRVPVGVADNDALATSGYRASAATSGDRATAATSGNRAAAATRGDGASAATSGDRASAVTSGDGASAATSGYQAAAATRGDRAGAMCSGPHSIGRCGNHGCVVLAEYTKDFAFVGWCVGRAGIEIEPHKWYEAKGGRLVEVGDDDPRVIEHNRQMDEVRKAAQCKETNE